jgi:hypothetical protein
MESAIRNQIMVEVLEELASCRDECQIIEFNPEASDERRESLSENFNEEIDIWARRALGANGFGDY